MKPFVDTSVFVGHWPFRRLCPRNAKELKQHLRRGGVTQAWVSPVEAILYPDPMQANQPMFAEIRNDDFFVAVPLVDVTLATWRQDVERSITQGGAKAVKITPNYHGYALDHPPLGELAALAAAHGVPLCIQVRMMDERSHHPLMKVPGVSTEQIAALARRHPATRFLVCAAYMSELKALRDAPNVWCEISHVEATQSLIMATRILPWQRLVFGSHSPFLYFEAVRQKLEIKTEGLTVKQIDDVAYANAANLLDYKKECYL